jgi:Ni/Fe-hydrogenase subunit HybB-like protein
MKQSVFRYLSYWLRMIQHAATGGRVYYVWLACLLLFVAMGAISWAHDISHGLVVTNMTDHVSWGIGIANFVYFVGVAAGAAVLVVPAYAYVRADVKQLVLLGELLAVCAIITCLLFILTDLGRPERLWHLMPPFGMLNLPSSLLSWDVVVFNGYLALNLHIPGYLLYKTYLGQKPSWWAYMPFVYVSMVWALAIHTVTAFLLSGLGSRPFWNTPILAPRFLISAGASAPALMIFIFEILRRTTKLEVKESVFDYFKYVLRIMMPINLFLLGCEVFGDFYTGALHSASARYLYFGIHGHNMLTRWIWTAIAFNVTATTIFLIPRLRDKRHVLYVACGLTIVGIWIEKGMGLIFPGFIPSPLGEIVEYNPSAGELFVTLGVVALGALLFTLMAKVTIAIQVGDLRLPGAILPSASDASERPHDRPQ